MIRLTPFYDLICTRAIDRIDANLAFDVGGQRNPANVTGENWIEFAKASDVGARYLTGLVSAVANLLVKRLPDAQQDFEQRYGNTPSLQRIEKIVKSQCKRMITSLG